MVAGDGHGGAQFTCFFILRRRSSRSRSTSDVALPLEGHEPAVVAPADLLLGPEPLEDELGGGGHDGGGLAGLHAQRFRVLEELGDPAELGHHLGRRRVVAQLQVAPALEEGTTFLRLAEPR